MVADVSWPHGGAVVLEVVLRDGTRAFVKQHRLARKHAAELAAYERWATAIPDRTAELLAADADARLIVLAALDGRPAPLHDVDVHRDAGAVLRRLHEAAPPAPDDGWAERQLASLERWVREAPPGLVTDEEVAWARAVARRLLDLPPLPVVPSHGDYQARNWLVDDDGRVLVIDFERAGPAWWVHDLGRLWFREWLERPGLRDAFLEGYGRGLGEVELAAIEALGAVGHVSTIVWATSVGDHGFAAEGRARLDRARGAGRG